MSIPSSIIDSFTIFVIFSIQDQLSIINALVVRWSINGFLRIFCLKYDAHTCISYAAYGLGTIPWIKVISAFRSLIITIVAIPKTLKLVALVIANSILIFIFWAIAIPFILFLISIRSNIFLVFDVKQKFLIFEMDDK